MEKLPPADGASAKPERSKKGARMKGPIITVPEISIEELEPPREPLVNVFTFGWMEDGRLGYPPDDPSYIQSVPRPIAAVRAEQKKRGGLLIPATIDDYRYICKKVACGYRHTLLLMENCYPEIDLKENDGLSKEKTNKLLITGLNQRGLCEEPGYEAPVEVEWDADERIVDMSAGNGFCAVTTRHGNVYTWGCGLHGVLGHGGAVTNPIPKQVMALNKANVVKIACGGFHVIATTAEALLYSWGRNTKGQLSRGFESPFEEVPDLVKGFEVGKQTPMQVVCGHEHTLALVKFKGREGTKNVIYGWGDESRGQLGSGDAHTRYQPQENRWVTNLLVKYNNMQCVDVAAGAYHNLVLTSTGQVVSWGAGDYGQLGHGSMWDDSRPNVINDLTGVSQIAAGARHSIAMVAKLGVVSWGYNGYGELGLGDDNIRTQPTVLTSFSRAVVRSVAACERQSLVITTHRAIAANEDPALRSYFAVVEENVNKMVIKQIKKTMEKNGFDPSLLDKPHAPLPNQVGSTDNPLRLDKFEKGIRYCMDSLVNPADWRRKSYEVCFEARLKGLHLKSVCLACARFCLSSLRLTPYVRIRSPGNTKCYCKESGMCVCYWSVIRSKFDMMAGEDGRIMPCNLPHLLKVLRAPAPVDIEDVEESLVELAMGAAQDAEEPRIEPVVFEKWYRRYYDEFEDAEAD